MQTNLIALFLAAAAVASALPRNVVRQGATASTLIIFADGTTQENDVPIGGDGTGITRSYHTRAFTLAPLVLTCFPETPGEGDQLSGVEVLNFNGSPQCNFFCDGNTLCATITVEGDNGFVDASAFGSVTSIVCPDL